MIFLKVIFITIAILSAVKGLFALTFMALSWAYLIRYAKRVFDLQNKNSVYIPKSTMDILISECTEWASFEL